MKGEAVGEGCVKLECATTKTNFVLVKCAEEAVPKAFVPHLRRAGLLHFAVLKGN